MRYVMAAVLALALSSHLPATPVVAAVSGSATVTGPEQIGAGDPLNVSVSAPVPDGTEAWVSLLGGLVHARRQVAFQRGTASATFAGIATERAGGVTVVAEVGGRTSFHEVQVAPGEPVAPLIPSVSPQRVEAGSDGGVLVTILPEDRFGNAVADLTEIDVTIRRPDGSIEVQSVQTSRLVGIVELKAIDLAGRNSIVVEVGGVLVESGFDVVPGSPAPFELIAPPIVPPADGYSTMFVETDVIHDEFGNPILDGKTAEVIVTRKSGSRYLTSTQVIGGRARVGLTSPREADTLSVTFVVDGVNSVPLELVFDAPRSMP